MDIFKRYYLMWVSGINPKFNRKLLSVPTPDMEKIYIQPERTSEKAPEKVMRCSDLPDERGRD